MSLGRLKRLNCHFWVICKVEVPPLVKGREYQVEAVKMTLKLEDVFIIHGKAYCEWYFAVKVWFRKGHFHLVYIDKQNNHRINQEIIAIHPLIIRLYVEFLNRFLRRFFTWSVCLQEKPLKNEEKGCFISGIFTIKRNHSAHTKPIKILVISMK